jgi:hypothetical protein
VDSSYFDAAEVKETSAHSEMLLNCSLARCTGLKYCCAGARARSAWDPFDFAQGLAFSSPKDGLF